MIAHMLFIVIHYVKHIYTHINQHHIDFNHQQQQQQNRKKKREDQITILFKLDLAISMY